MAALAVDPGMMRERVRFEARGTVADEYGNDVTGEFAPQFTRPALFIMKPGSETVLAARLQGQQPVTMIVHYDSKTRTIGTDWRAVDVRTGTVYAVRASEDMDRKRQWWTLVCVAGEVA
ncbi:phage head-tail adapter protein [Methylobacterium sp. Leaf399]|uniref:phage head closure protein n=1 Tax=Methylobacterium sp. Leaf399 TaxID=1736364 RepID=UPI0006F9CD4D|nr:phage head closure protein [Methylobacterium sp. Leaf399]KQT08524.1 phage head-tail adapter protein [Methylobacterium sp. Leaf399]